MNVLTLSNSPLDPSFGSGRTVISFTEGLKRGGHSVKLMDSTLLSWGKGRGAILRLAYGARKAIKRSVDLSKIDLVELYGGEFWPVVNWVRKHKTCPVIVSHSNGFELLDLEQKNFYLPKATVIRSLFENFRKKQIRSTFQLSDYQVFLSEADASFAIHLGIGDKNKTVVIPPGLSPDFLNRSINSNQTHAVGFLGSWSERKNPTGVVTVFSSLAARDPNLRFELFGTRISPELVKSFFPLDIHSRLTIHGQYDDKVLAEKLSQIKVLLNPSWYEGFGLGIAEAMACGCAVVSTPTGYACELDSKNEVRVVGFGDYEQMVRVIMETIGNNEEREALRIRAHKKVQSLRWELSCNSLIKYYEEWVEKSKQRALSRKDQE